MTLLYVLPGLGRPFKRAGLLKPFVVGAVWGWATVILPWVEQAPQGWRAGWIWLAFAHNGLAVSAAAPLFDLRDILGDQKSGLRGPGQVLGAGGTGWMARLVAAMALVLGIVLVTRGTTSPALLSLSVAILALSLVPPRDKDSLYYGVLVDGALGLPGLWMILSSLSGG